jgi:two-component system OmpR family response regulator
VDGDLTSQQTVVQALIESGWRVTIVETGRSAVYEASLSNFDLVVVDTLPPQKDGNETARTIRKLEEFSGRRATIIGIGSPDNTEQNIVSGIDDFLSVPVNKEELKERLLLLKEQ